MPALHIMHLYFMRLFPFPLLDGGLGLVGYHCQQEMAQKGTFRLQSHVTSTFLQSVKVNYHSLPAVVDTLNSVGALRESLHDFIWPQPRTMKLFTFSPLHRWIVEPNKIISLKWYTMNVLVIQLSAIVVYFLFFF